MLRLDRLDARRIQNLPCPRDLSLPTDPQYLASLSRASYQDQRAAYQPCDVEGVSHFSLFQDIPQKALDLFLHALVHLRRPSTAFVRCERL